MREVDIKNLFHAGNRRDANNFDQAMREARSAPSQAAVFACDGKEFLLLQNLDDDSWSYRAL